MRNLLAGAMVITMALCFSAATLAFGAVTPDFAAPACALAILLALLWAAKLAFAEVVSWKKSPLHLPVVAFMIYATARHFTSPIEYESRLEWLQVLLCGFLYFVAAANFYRTRDRSILLKLLMALAILESLYGLWQFATHAQTVLRLERPDIYYNRGGGTFICPNHLAGFLEMVLGLVLGNLAIRKVSQASVQRATMEKVLFLYAAVMLLAGIVTTLSRAGWIATAAGVFVVLVWGDWRSRAMWPRLAVAAVTVAMMVFIVSRLQPARDYLSLTLRPASERDVPTLKDPTMGGRTLLWKATWEMIRDRPIFGTGPATWQWFHLKYRKPLIWSQAEHTHNDFLNLASDYGLIGFAILLAVFLRFYRHASLLAGTGFSSEQRGFAVGAIISVTIILVHSWFDFNLHIPANSMLLATIMGLTVAMEDSEKHHPRIEMKRLPRYILAAALLVFVAGGAWLWGHAALSVRYTSVGADAKAILRWDWAINYFEHAIALDPKYPEPYIRLADVYRAQSEWRRDPARANDRLELAQAAAEIYRRALKLNPYRSAVYVRLARVLEMTGQDDQELNAYQQALAVDPNNAFNHFRLGCYYRRMALSFSSADFTNLPALVEPLRKQADPVSRYLWSRFSEPAQRVLTAANSTPQQLQATLVTELNAITRGDSIYDAQRFAAVQLSEQARKLVAQEQEGNTLRFLNRLLLEDAYPAALSKSRRIEEIKKAAAALEKSCQLFSDNDIWIAFVEVRDWLEPPPPASAP